jgi:hypothetical protein
MAASGHFNKAGVMFVWLGSLRVTHGDWREIDGCHQEREQRDGSTMSGCERKAAMVRC